MTQPAAKIENTLLRDDGTPASYAGVLTWAVDRITKASRLGRPLRLRAEEVRALDWAVIRMEGGIDTDDWLERRP